MKMKKILTAMLVATMVFGIVGCGNNENIKNQTNSNTDNVQEQDSAQTNTEDKIGKGILDQFNEIMAKDSNMSTDEIANELCANPAIEYALDTMPVEEGLLTGFDNAEIKGFKEGTMFSPMIGSIPFVGYVFRVNDDTDVNTFMDELKQNANLRWNVCTEADKMMIEHKDSVVLFVMYSTSEE